MCYVPLLLHIRPRKLVKVYRHSRRCHGDGLRVTGRGMMYDNVVKHPRILVFCRMIS